MQDRLRNARLHTFQQPKGACAECGGRVVCDRTTNLNGGRTIVSKKYCLDCGIHPIPWWKRLSPTERMMHFLRVGKYDPSRR
jgi:hypothetical protein